MAVFVKRWIKNFSLLNKKAKYLSDFAPDRKKSVLREFQNWAILRKCSEFLFMQPMAVFKLLNVYLDLKINFRRTKNAGDWPAYAPNKAKLGLWVPKVSKMNRLQEWENFESQQAP